MKLQKKILCLALLIVSCGVSAQLFQEGKISTGTQIDFQTFQNSELTTMQLTEPSEVEGNPFLFPTYVPAEVVFIGTDQKPINLLLNYNVYADLMKMSKSEETDEVRMLPKASNFDILMNDKRFRYVDFNVDGKTITSYIEILDSYDDESLLALHRIQEIQKGTTSKSSYSIEKKDTYRLEQHYYYINNDGLAIELDNNKRKVTKNMSDTKKDQIKDFIKENKIEFDDDLRGLKGVAKYYNSIK